MDSPSAPMLPMSIILVGIHVYVLWYLLGGEFESDFEDEEEVPFFSVRIILVVSAKTSRYTL